MMGNPRLHLVAQQSVEMPVCPSGSDSLGNALHPALNSPAWALPAPAGTPLCPRATAAAPAPHFHTLPSLLLPTSTTQTFFLAASRGLQVLFKEEGPAQAVEQILVGFAGFLGLSQCLGYRHQRINRCSCGLVPSQLLRSLGRARPRGAGREVPGGRRGAGSPGRSPRHCGSGVPGSGHCRGSRLPWRCQGRHCPGLRGAAVAACPERLGQRVRGHCRHPAGVTSASPSTASGQSRCSSFVRSRTGTSGCVTPSTGTGTPRCVTPGQGQEPRYVSPPVQ